MARPVNSHYDGSDDFEIPRHDPILPDQINFVEPGS